MTHVTNISESLVAPHVLLVLVQNLSAILWPIVVLAIFFALRKQLGTLLRTFSRQLAAGARIKYGELEFGGTHLFPVLTASEDDGTVKESTATQADYDRKQAFYFATQQLNLVHKIRTSIEPDQKFDIEISILAHKGKTRLNEIEFVEYYFGGWFGKKPHGSKFRVEDSSLGFAVITSAYGEFLCVADVRLRDGSTVTLTRYIDFEMAGVAAVAPEAVSKKAGS